MESILTQSDSQFFLGVLSLCESLLYGYAITILLLFVIRCIVGKPGWLVNLLNTANYIVLGIAVFRLVNWVWGVINLYQSGYLYEQYAFYNRALGKYWWAYAAMYVAQLLPLLFIVKSIRTGFGLPIVLLLSSGMFIERYIIIYTSLMDDYLPATWSYVFEPFLPGLLCDFCAFDLLMALILLIQHLWNKFAIKQVLFNKKASEI